MEVRPNFPGHILEDVKRQAELAIYRVLEALAMPGTALYSVRASPNGPEAGSGGCVHVLPTGLELLPGAPGGSVADTVLHRNAVQRQTVESAVAGLWRRLFGTGQLAEGVTPPPPQCHLPVAGSLRPGESGAISGPRADGPPVQGGRFNVGLGQGGHWLLPNANARVFHNPQYCRLRSRDKSQPDLAQPDVLADLD